MVTSQDDTVNVHVWMSVQDGEPAKVATITFERDVTETEFSKAFQDTFTALKQEFDKPIDWDR